MRVDVARVHDGRDGEDDDGSAHTLHRAGRDLAHRDQTHRQRRQHPVLDLLGVAELLDHRQGDRLDALEHDRQPDDTGHEHGGERRLAAGASAADALADLREHVEEHEDQQQRLDDRARDELVEVLA